MPLGRLKIVVLCCFLGLISCCTKVQDNGSQLNTVWEAIQLEEYSNAVKLAEDFLKNPSIKKYPKHRGNLWSAKGVALMNLGSLDSAIKSHRIALVLRKKYDKAAAPGSWHNLINCYATLLDTSAVHTLYQKYKSSTAYYNDSVMAKIELTIGGLSNKLKLFEKAKVHYYQAQKLLNEIQDTLSETYNKTQIGLANTELNLEKPDSADKYILKLNAKIDSLYLRGIYHRLKKDWQKATNCQAQAKTTLDNSTSANCEETLNISIELSALLERKNEFDEAIALLEQVLYQLTCTIDSDTYLVLYNNLGNLYQKIGEIPQAIAYYEKASSYLNPHTQEEKSAIFYNLALLYDRIDSTDISRSYLDILLKMQLDIKTKAQALVLSGSVHQSQSNTSSALQDLQKAYNLINRQRDQNPDIFSNLTVIYAEVLGKIARFESADRFLNEGWQALGRPFNLQDTEWPVETLELLMAQATVALWKYKSRPKNELLWRKAYEQHKLAINYLEEHRWELSGEKSLLYTSLNHRSLYEGMVELCYDKGRKNKRFIEEAFINAERSKAYLLWRLHLKNQPIDKSKYKIAPGLSPSTLNKKLANDQSLISYLEVKDQVYLFVLNKQGLVAKRLDLPHVFFEKRLKIWFTLLRQPTGNATQLAKIAKIGHEMYLDLLKPMEDYLKPRILIIPDGLLYFVPFEAMLSSKPQDSDLDDYPFLIYDYSFAYNYSAAFVNAPITKIMIPSKLFLGMAPVFDGIEDGLSKLVNSEKEIKEAATTLNMKRRLFCRALADEQAFLKYAPQAQIILLATHGFFKRDIDSSFIAFSDYQPDKSENGRLTVEEINRLKLQAELVFMSACETSFGEVYGAEGMLSLSRSFFEAGAKSLIATLWSIPDKETSTLVPLFFVRLKQGKAKDIALAEAKREFLRSSKGRADHPAYWAAFTLNGDLGALEVLEH
jgi:CHAT domain-containing protein